MTFFYGELFISNSDIKEGVWITNPVIEKSGIKTGDKIIAVDGVKIDRFNEINEKVLLGKEVIVERNGTEQKVNLPVDFINQLMDGKKISVVELRLPFIVSGVEENSANKSSVQEKDVVTSFNGVSVQYADQIISAVKELKGKTVPAIVKRDGNEIAVSIVVNDSSKMGIQYAARLPYDNIEKLGLYPIRKQNYGFFESIPVGIERGKDQLVGYWKQLQMIFTPSTGAYKGVGGFKAIFDIFPASWSWEAFWSITALLSIMLGVMNLLPIPALDGGHVMFLLYEIISRRKPSDKFMENAQMVGFVLLISLLLFANGNDIYKAIVGK
jgi:regulator of sigma E protease